MNKTPCTKLLTVFLLWMSPLTVVASPVDISDVKQLHLRGVDVLLDGGSVIYMFEDDVARPLRVVARNEREFKFPPRQIEISRTLPDSTDPTPLAEGGPLEGKLLKLLSRAREEAGSQTAREAIAHLITIVEDRSSPIPRPAEVRRIRKHLQDQN